MGLSFGPLSAPCSPVDKVPWHQKIRMILFYKSETHTCKRRLRCHLIITFLPFMNTTIGSVNYDRPASSHPPCHFQNKKVKALLRFHLDMIPLTSEKHDPRFKSRDWFHRTVEDWSPSPPRLIPFSDACKLDTLTLFHTGSHQRTVEMRCCGWNMSHRPACLPACLQGFASFDGPDSQIDVSNRRLFDSHLGSSCRALIGKKVPVSNFFFLSQISCGPAERVSWPHHLRGEVNYRAPLLWLLSCWILKYSVKK